MSDHGGHNTLLRLNMLRFLFSKRRIGALRKPVARRMFETPLGTRGPFSRVPRVPCSDSPGAFNVGGLCRQSIDSRQPCQMRLRMRVTTVTTCRGSQSMYGRRSSSSCPWYRIRVLAYRAIKDSAPAKDPMSELPDVRNMLDEAEAAANSGDLASANDLLQRVARIQETELGPLHPDLADTLNNLAIVAETTGRLGDAERFYRRAVAVASASLPADDPKVASSRQHLEAFCRQGGVPIDAAAALVAEPKPPRRAAADNGVVADAKTPPQVESAAAA